jgi:hypothetical protein
MDTPKTDGATFYARMDMNYLLCSGYKLKGKLGSWQSCLVLGKFGIPFQAIIL